MYQIHKSTSDDYSPWDLLPAPIPKDDNPPFGYFYDYVAKHLIKDTVRIMNNGLPIDLTKVRELELELDTIIAKVHKTLEHNPIIKQYQSQRYEQLHSNYVKDRQSMLRTYEYYLKPFDHKKMDHRSYFMLIFAIHNNLSAPSELLPTGVPKWSANQVKVFAASRPILQRLLKGELNETNSDYVKEAMMTLAVDRARLYNRKFESQIESLSGLELPPFNPGSPDQKHGVLTDLLGYESDKLSDSYKDYEHKLRNAERYGKPYPEPPKNKFSWDRDNVERLTPKTPDETELFQSLVDYSMGAIVKNNFIRAFYEYSLPDSTGQYRLHGNYKLLGAKTGRYTSSNPNMLNSPSTGSLYAKPVKSCFIAPPGYVVWSIDYSSLEDRVLASLTHDPGKLAIYEQKLDGHCFSTLGYFADKVYEHIDNTGDLAKDAIAFKEAVDSGNKTLKDLRQASKPITFKLAYLGVADSERGGSITPEIYESYHNILYPNIMKQVNKYILPASHQNGMLHLGLGFYIKTDNPERDVRTLNNSLSQFWSLLTATSINELHRRIDKTLSNINDIQTTATIYDAIYGIAKADAELIQWLNVNVVEIMTKDFIVDQAVKNEANLEIGTNWASLHELPNNATLVQIQQTLKEL